MSARPHSRTGCFSCAGLLLPVLSLPVLLGGCALFPLKQDDGLALAGENITGSLPASPSNSRDISISGIAPGEIGLFFSNDCTGDAAARATPNTNGVFTVVATVPPNTATDISIGDGNTCTPLGSYIHDDVPPTVQLASAPSGAGNTQLVTLSASTEEEASLAFFASAQCLGPEVGTVLMATPNASNVFSARATDRAGNTACASVAYVHDDIAPSIDAITFSSSAGATGSLSITWAITEAGAGVVSNTLCEGVSPSACTPVLTTTQQSAVRAPQPERVYYTVSATDAAGNVGQALASVRSTVVAGNVAQVVVDSGSTCARMGDGTVQCWGGNDVGQLGNGTPSNMATSTPNAVVGVSGAVQICGQQGHWCALTRTGDVLCWGENNLGQAGLNPAITPAVLVPTKVLGVSAAKDVACAAGATCAALLDGSVSCWGDNTEKQLSRTSATLGFVPEQTNPVLQDVIQLSAGLAHLCALHANGTVSCWGRNDLGQSGQNSFVVAGSLAAGVSAASGVTLNQVVSIAAGFQHSCAARVDGTVRCWGTNADGQLGVVGPTDHSVADVGPTGVTGAVSLHAGADASCAVRANGQMKCWSMTDLATPQAQTQVEQAGLSSGTFCVVQSNGNLRCWGSNDMLQIDAGVAGLRAPTNREFLPTRVGVKQLGAGDAHACALLFDGSVYCWGDNAHLQLGVSGVSASLPVRVPGTVPTHLLAVGGRHTCRLMAGGAVNCFGDNGLLQVRTVAGPDAPPTDIFTSGQRFRSISAGAAHNCAIYDDGSAQCWGNNANGQLSQLVAGGRVTTQTNTTLTQIRSVSAGGEHSCLTTADGKTRCWGDNSQGQCGSNAVSGQRVNTSFSVPHNPATVVSAGGSHTCLVNGAGVVRCLGANSEGQLGTGITSVPGVSGPTAASPDLVALDVSAGKDTTCIVRNAESRCWGGHATGITPGPLTSQQWLPGLQTHIAVGATFTCASTPDGDVSCAGDNAESQLAQQGPARTTPAKSPHLP